MLLSNLGCHWSVTAGRLTPSILLRLAALAPLFLLIVPPFGRVLVWLGIAVLALGAGALASGAVDSRSDAVVANIHAPSVRNTRQGLAVLRVTARPREGSRGVWSAPARVLSWHADPAISAGPRLAGEIAAPAADRAAPRPGEGALIRTRGVAPLLGDLVGGWWQLASPRRAAVPGGFDEAAWLNGRGLTWIASPAQRTAELSVVTGGGVARLGRIQSSVQRRARDLLAAGLPPREAALAAAVLLGGGVDRNLREPFVKLGLAHLFALSGLHVGIVSGVLLLVLRVFVRGPGWPLPLMFVSLVFYALLVDTPDSVVRAVGLVLLTLTLRASGRPIDGLRLLGLLLWLNVLWRPEGLFDVGMRLSYLAAGGIVLGQRLLGADLQACPRILRWPARGLSVSFCAQTATLPVLAGSFGVLPLAAPLTNVLAVPLFGLAAGCLAGGLLLSPIWGWAGQGMLACAWLLLRPLQAATAQAGGHLDRFEIGLPIWGPGRTLAYAACLGLLVLILRRRRLRVRLLAIPVQVALLVVAVAWGHGMPRRDSVQAWQFAVDQGDCALVRLPDGWTCLIDTGPGWHGGGGPVSRDVAPFLRRLNMRHIDAVVLTHGHADHTAGAADLARRFSVGHWYLAGKASVPDSLMRWSRPAAGDTLHAAGSWALVCVHPPSPRWTASNENDRSLSLALCRNGRMHGLWTGDLEKPGEKLMLPRLPGVSEEGLDYWKAGHHGSRTSGSPELLDQTRPQLVVISCGVANRHRHPSRGSYGDADHARTDLQATVSLRWDRHGRLRWHAMYRLPQSAAGLP